MMEIEFRGKSSVNGNWYYGLLSESKGYASQPKEGFYISNKCGMPWAYQVIPETIGLFTGLKDKNDKKIYKGDIVTGGALMCTGGYSIMNDKSTVKFESGMFKAGCISLCSINHYCEVIGNIYDNPELLKG